MGALCQKISQAQAVSCDSALLVLGTSTSLGTEVWTASVGMLTAGRDPPGAGVIRELGLKGCVRWGQVGREGRLVSSLGVMGTHVPGRLD